jgi:hypothetical protein
VDLLNTDLALARHRDVLAGAASERLARRALLRHRADRLARRANRLARRAAAWGEVPGPLRPAG